MITEVLTRRASAYAALGEPSRLAIVDRLTLGDASPSEIGRELGVPSNLLSHHLKLLEHAGIVDRSRSEGDHRRTYLRLNPEAPVGVSATELRLAPRVVFVCTQNSARSQLSAALWSTRSVVPAVSAGTHPTAHVHPRAVTLALDRGLSLGHAQTAHIDDVLDDADLVIAVCDNAHEELGTRAADRLHWSVRDPVRLNTDVAFDQAFQDIADRINRLAPSVQLPGVDHV